MFDKEIDSLIFGKNRFRNEDWIKENLPDLHFFIYNYPIGSSFKEKIFHFRNGSSIPICYCGKSLEFISLSKGYRKYCSKNCQVKSPSSKQKRKETCLSKYGFDNPMKNSEIKNRYIESIVDTYGVDNIGKRTESKEKLKITNRKKYGVDHISQLDRVKKSLSGKLKNRSLDMNKIRSENIKLEIIDKVQQFDVKFVDIISTSLYLMCHLDHQFEIHKTTLNDRIKNGNTICTVCNKIESGSDAEKSILNFIKSNYSKSILENCRNVISGEIDIYLPDDKLAFEYNGVFWHSDEFKNSSYHINKTKECDKNGIKLIHIWEDDWKYKNDIVRSRILNLIGGSKKIWARSCVIREVSVVDSQDFLDKNHIQGGCISKIRIGLYHKDKLVSLMTFGPLRKSLGQNSKESHYELIRFCNEIGLTVVGGASKIFNYFLNKYIPISVVSYADRCWSSGSLYHRLGFTFCGETKPNYYWIINGIRKNRFNYRKDVLVRGGFDSKLSEHEIMKSRGYNKIWDSGSLKFIFRGF